MGRPTREVSTDHAEKLADLAARVAAARDTLSDLEAERDAEILAAHNAGGSLRQIAAAAGVSHTWVKKLSARG